MLEEAIIEGQEVDRQRLHVKLLVQEIDFFMTKKTGITDRISEIENELANVFNTSKTAKSTWEIEQMKTEIYGLKLSVGFFDRQISTALYELKSRDNKRDLRVFLWKPVSLTAEVWNKYLDDEGLQNLTSRKQLDK